MRKGHTQWRGEKNYRARLKAADVRAIRALLNTETQAEIARRFCVAPSEISRIAAGRIWRHVE